MLVVSRRKSESVTCRLPDGQIMTVTLLKIMGHKVRLGFEGPRAIQVTRSELLAMQDACQQIEREELTQPEPQPLSA